MPEIFSDNMILQQQTEAPVWGNANPSENINLMTSWDKKTYTTRADKNGNWQIKVNTPVAGGPYEISINAGKEKLHLRNVLIGEVWICSGQSNMEMPVGGWGKALNYVEEIKAADYSQIRLLHVERGIDLKPSENIKTRGGWQECSPETVYDFTAVGYFFGRDLYKHLNIPIGLISTSWGGSFAQAWTSKESLEQMPDFYERTQELTQDSNITAFNEFKKKWENWHDLILSADNGYKKNKAIWAEQKFNDKSWKTMILPSILEKTDELIDFDGIIWFRKEIEIPSEWEGKDLILRLDRIDDNDITYFNGHRIGTTEGWDIDRIYKVPGNLVKRGKAIISVRLTDNHSDGGIYGDAQKMYFFKKNAENGIHLSLAGEWKYQPAVNFKDYPAPPSSWLNNKDHPMVLYNAMLHPLIPYSIQGAIWYQGESNTGKPYQYRELFPMMIRDWRKQWDNNFPFYFVQLANFMERKDEPQESHWAALREAQLQTLRLENTGMAVAIDVGEADDVHPKNKQEVGRRLALNALAKTYGKNIEYSGPVYQSYQLERNKIRIHFSHTTKGLKTTENYPVKGFAIAGPDHKFYWADAVIDGNDVIVSSPDVEFPVAVRYAWADNPDCNLYNSDNLPASPFRTDDWNTGLME